MKFASRLVFILSFMSPVFLGSAPLFGKLAYQGGSDPFTVAALRTLIAAAILWAFYAILWRRYLYIYPAGLLGCVVVGAVNGIGSLMYYSGLSLLDASTAQLLNGTYVIFAVVLARIAGQQITTRTLVRVGMALFAILLITGLSATTINWLGVGLMLGNAIMFAGTVLLSQRVLYEMPARTVTIYSLTTMAVIVIMARLAYGFYNPVWSVTPQAWSAIIALGITTALARLTMFIGVKALGGLQTTTLAMTEIGATLLLAFIFLGDRLTLAQWVGVAILGASILLMRGEDRSEAGAGHGIALPNMAGLTLFHQMAFDQAFGKSEVDISPEELQAIRRMMGASAEQPPPPKPRTLHELPTAHRPAEKPAASSSAEVEATSLQTQ